MCLSPSSRRGFLQSRRVHFNRTIGGRHHRGSADGNDSRRRAAFADGGAAVSCQANLHQWALAVQNYATIHHGELPRRGQGVQPTTQFDRPNDWFNALPPLMESEPLTRRLADNVPPVPGESGPWMCPDLLDNGQPQYFAYGMNMWLSTSKGANPDRIDKVGPTTTMVFLADGIGTQCSVLPANSPYSPAPRHGGYVNLAFLDGHVTAFSGPEVGCGVGDPSRPDIRWVVPGSPWTGP